MGNNMCAPPGKQTSDHVKKGQSRALIRMERLSAHVFPPIGVRIDTTALLCGICCLSMIASRVLVNCG